MKDRTKDMTIDRTKDRKKDRTKDNTKDRTKDRTNFSKARALIYRVSHSKPEKVILLWYEHRF